MENNNLIPLAFDARALTSQTYEVSGNQGRLDFAVYSSKTTEINGVNPTTSLIDFDISNSPNWVTIEKIPYSNLSYYHTKIRITANTGSARTGTLTLTQKESGKTCTITIKQKKKLDFILKVQTMRASNCGRVFVWLTSEDNTVNSSAEDLLRDIHDKYRYSPGATASVGHPIGPNIQFKDDQWVANMPSGVEIIPNCWVMVADFNYPNATDYYSSDINFFARTDGSTILDLVQVYPEIIRRENYSLLIGK